MSRTPYSLLVEKARAPLPWKAGRCVGRSVEFRVISSGLSLRAPGWSVNRASGPGPCGLPTSDGPRDQSRPHAQSDLGIRFRNPRTDHSDFQKRPISEPPEAERVIQPRLAAFVTF